MSISMSVSGKTIRRVIKPPVHLVLAVPLLLVLWDVYGYVTTGFSDSLGANPPEAVNRHLGEWSIRMLLLALAVSPAAKLLAAPKLVLFRRMIGLWAFAYAAVHLTAYVALDKVFLWPDIWNDITAKTFISVGMGAFVLLLALALTSPAAAVRRLGPKRWKRLHRCVYGAAGLAVLHFFMLRKGIQVEPLIHGGILVLLLLLRWPPLAARLKRRKAGAALG